MTPTTANDPIPPDPPFGSLALQPALAFALASADLPGRPPRFTSWSARMAEITGLSMDEANSTGWLISALGREAASALFENQDSGGTEISLTGPGGVARVVRLTTARLERHGIAPEILVVIDDLTVQQAVHAEREKLIEELESRNGELERFTYTVSHDLKSPLITIRGFLGYLEAHALRGDVERFRADLARITDATARMQRLLDELLQLSRVGRIVKELEPVSFDVIAREAAALVAGRAAARGAVVEIFPGLPVVLGDRTRLVEALQNLLDNAIKFTGPGRPPRIEIAAGSSLAADETILFVRDNGMGIEPELCSRVFGLFEKLDAKSEGTGIGLAIVKRIIEVHGGRIWMESAGLGRGTTVAFSLKLAKDEGNPSEEVIGDPTEDELFGSPGKRA